MEKNKTPQKIKVAGVLYEKIPERIRVEGKLYILAEGIKHKKCAKGTHWNYKQKKCLKLPPDLAAARKKALKSSKVAHRAGLTKSDLWNAHEKAYNNHVVAHGLAKKHGFGGLTTEHKKARIHHWREWKRWPWDRATGQGT